MSKSKKIILVIIAIAIILLAFIGGHTYAKYMSRITGQGTADIASWNFKVNDKTDNMQTISLKSTINNGTLVNNKIAPGTQGSFEIKIDATGSEVGINYIVKLENETQKPTNLKFIYEEKTYNSITELQNVLVGTINATDEEKVKSLIINWNWPYETGATAQEIAENDLIDTENGKTIDNYSFDIIVSGIQEVPEN